MNNNNEPPNKSEPYEDNDDFDLNDLLKYIDDHGTILDDKKKKVLNPELISLGNKQIIIKRSLFAHDHSFKERLLKLPREGIDDVLRMVIESILFRYLTDSVYVDFIDWEVILINDD